MNWLLAVLTLLLALTLAASRFETRALYKLCAAYRRLRQTDERQHRSSEQLIAAMREYIAVLERQNTQLRIAAEHQARKVRN